MPSSSPNSKAKKLKPVSKNFGKQPLPKSVYTNIIDYANKHLNDNGSHKVIGKNGRKGRFGPDDERASFLDNVRSFVKNLGSVKQRGKGTFDGTSETNFTTTSGLFSSYITNYMRRYFRTRDELTAKAITKQKFALTSKWYELKIEDPKSIDKKFIRIERDLMRRAQFQYFLQQATDDSLTLGTGWIGMFFDSKSGITQYPEGATEVKLSIIDDDNIRVKKWMSDTRSINVREPAQYEVSNSTGKFGKDKVHASRILRVVVRPRGNELRGESIIDPNFDKLISKKRFDWALLQTYWRYAIPLVEIVTPNDTKAYTDAKSAFGDHGIQGMKVFVHRDEGGHWQIKMHKGEGAVLPPTEFYDAIINPLLAGLGTPRNLIMDTKGSSQTNQSNTENWYSEMSGIQNTSYTPLIRKFHEICYDAGIFEALGWKRKLPKYELIWNPIFELSAKDLAQEKLMTARTHVLYSFTDKGIGALTHDDIREELGKPDLTDEQIDKELELMQKITEAKTVKAKEEEGDPEEDDETSSTKAPFDTTGE